MQAKQIAELLIIADDFTGANDSGVQLTKKGAQVTVYFDWQHDQPDRQSDVLVINSDSRAVPASEAKQRVTQIVRQNRHRRPIYKKIDSTLRGNLGAEIEAILQQSEYAAAIIVPAFPAMQRTVVNGRCYVAGCDLMATEFASDPKTPLYASRISECLRQQTSLNAAEIPLTQVRTSRLATHLECRIAQGAKLLIVDAETDADLRLIAEAITTLTSPLLMVGSAGLINVLPFQFHAPIRHITPAAKQPLLVVAGSMSSATHTQVATALASGDNWQLVDIDVAGLLPVFSPEQLRRYSQAVNHALVNGQHTIIRTCQSMGARHNIAALCQQHKLTRQQLGDLICAALAHIILQTEAYNLFLTGGDVAIAVAKALGASGFILYGEVAPGVPYGQLIGQQPLPYRLFTKAGGFGQPTIFTESLALL